MTFPRGAIVLLCTTVVFRAWIIMFENSLASEKMDKGCFEFHLVGFWCSDMASIHHTGKAAPDHCPEPSVVIILFLNVLPFSFGVGEVGSSNSLTRSRPFA